MQTPRGWETAEWEKAVELRRGGQRPSVIARMIGRTRNSVEHALRNIEGLEKFNPPRPVTDEDAAAIRTDRAAGASVNRLAERYNRSHHTIRKIVGGTECGRLEEHHDGRRGPLPAGHSLTWDLLTRGTILEGVEFRACI